MCMEIVWFPRQRQTEYYHAMRIVHGRNRAPDGLDKLIWFLYLLYELRTINDLWLEAELSLISILYATAV